MDLAYSNQDHLFARLCNFQVNITVIPFSNIPRARFQNPFFRYCATGRRILTVTYSNKGNQGNHEYAVIAGLNVWDFVLNTEEIFYMSYGCGESLGNVISWLAVRNEVHGKITLHSPATCREHTGEDYYNTLATFLYIKSIFVRILLLVLVVGCLVFIPLH